MFIESPKMASTGSEKKDIEQLRSYLFRMSEQLNLALENVNGTALYTQNASQTGGSGSSDGKDVSSGAISYDELRSLIIKTANEIHVEMDTIVTELEGKYVAVSDFGVYKEETDRRIEENAKGTLDYFTFKQEISPKVETLENDVATATNTANEAVERADALETDIENVSNTANAAVEKAGALETDVENVSNATNAVTERTDALETDIENVSNATNAVTDRANAIENTINEQQSGLNEISQRVSGAEADITASQQAIRDNEALIKSEEQKREEEIARTDNEIEALKENVDSISDKLGKYQVNTEQFIRTGLLYYEKAVIDGVEVSIPRIGVAIGENLTTITIEDPETGEKKEVLSRQGLYTTYTSDKLSFYLNDVEVAYISNGKLYISEAEIFGFKLKTGKWLVNTESDYWNLEWEG